MRFLTHAEFGTLLDAVTEPWQPITRFLVASGARISKATALRPGDVHRDDSTVRISRAWKRRPGGYTIGAHHLRAQGRARRSRLTGEWLFTNPGNGAGGPNPSRRGAGGPVRPINLRRNFWYPAVRAKLAGPQPASTTSATRARHG